jgi:hypothetical protein
VLLLVRKKLPKWPYSSWISTTKLIKNTTNCIPRIAVNFYANFLQTERLSLPLVSNALSQACLCWCAQDDELSTSLFNGVSPHQLTLLSLAICCCCFCSARCFYLPNPHHISINSCSILHVVMRCWESARCPRRACGIEISTESEWERERERDRERDRERGWLHLQPQDKHLFSSCSAKRRNLGNCLSKQARSLAHTHEFALFRSLGMKSRVEWEVNAALDGSLKRLSHSLGTYSQERNEL